MKKKSVVLLTAPISLFVVFMFLLLQGKTNETTILPPKPIEKPSIVDKLEKLAKTKDKLTIVALGSSVTRGSGASGFTTTWPNLLYNYLNGLDNLKDKITVVNDGNPGFTTKHMKEASAQLSDIIQSKPDIILFETCILNDAKAPLPIKTTLQNLDDIVTKLQSALPQTMIIVQSPNPKKDNNEKNKLNLSYLDYLDATKTHAQQQGWLYIDVYDEFLKMLKDNNLKLSDVISEDGLHPNDQGYAIWCGIIAEYFQHHDR